MNIATWQELERDLTYIQKQMLKHGIRFVSVRLLPNGDFINQITAFPKRKPWTDLFKQLTQQKRTA